MSAGDSFSICLSNSISCVSSELISTHSLVGTPHLFVDNFSLFHLTTSSRYILVQHTIHHLVDNFILYPTIYILTDDLEKSMVGTPQVSKDAGALCFRITSNVRR